MEMASFLRFNSSVFPMYDKIGFDVAVGPCRMILRFLGAWPDPVASENIFSICRVIIASMTMFIFAILAQTTMVIKVWGNFNAMIEILTVADVPIFVALMKFLIAWYYRKVLKGLVVTMSEDWQRHYSNQDFQEIWQRSKFSRKLSIVCISLALGTISVQFIQVVILHFNYKNERPLYMTSYFPYNTQISPNYEFTWIAQCFSNIYAASAFSSIDAFFAVLVLHLCGQLAILKRALVQLMDGLQDGITKTDFTCKIANIVERHEFLNRFAKTIEDSFNMMFLAQMIVSSFALCIQGYQLIMIITDKSSELPLLHLIHMIYFTCCFAFSLFAYCYVAEQLHYESTEIHYAAYNIKWYNLSPKETRLLLLLMHRARKPLEITAGKFCIFSLRLYCSILKTSGGYLSMLLAARHRLIPDV